MGNAAIASVTHQKIGKEELQEILAVDAAQGDKAELKGIVTLDEALRELNQHSDTDKRGFLSRKQAFAMMKRLLKRKQYEEVTALIHQLRKHHVRLIKPEFLAECLDNGKSLPCRQHCPEHAFLDIDEYSNEELEAKLVIFVVSYCWLSLDHPDPNNFHLATLAKFFDVYKGSSESTSTGFYGGEPASYWKSKGVQVMGNAKKNYITGIFIDWTAMPQEEIDGGRSPEDDQAFEEGLKNVHLWYASKQTIVIKLNYLPKDQPSNQEWTDPHGVPHPAQIRSNYDDSGWPYFEESVARMIKPRWNIINVTLKERGRLLQGYYKADAYKYNEDELIQAGIQSKARWVPDFLMLVVTCMDDTRGTTISPSAFNDLVATKYFAKSADLRQIIIPKYEAAFTEIIGSANILDYSKLGLTDNIARKALMDLIAAGFCSEMRAFDASYNLALKIPLSEWAEALSSGAPKLQELLLVGNKRIGGDLIGLSALTSLVRLELGLTQARGDVAHLSGLSRLSKLNLRKTNVEGSLSGLSGLTRLQELHLYNTWVQGDLADLSSLVNLIVLNLASTPIQGDVVGLSKLTNLEELRLFRSQGQEGVIGDVSGISSLTNLTFLDLVHTQVEGDIGGLANLTKLAELRLYGSLIQGDLMGLSSLTNLAGLDVHNTQICGDVDAIAELSSLTSLNLSATQVFGDIEMISELTELRVLNLSATQLVGDATVLSTLVKLKELRLPGGILGDEAELRVAIPAFTVTKTGKGEEGKEDTYEKQRKITKLQQEALTTLPIPLSHT